MASGAGAGNAPRPSSAPEWRPTRRVVAVLAAAYWSYAVNGVVNSEIGPVLLGMAQSFQIDLAAAGAIFTAQFAGYLPGALGGGMAADRWGYRAVLVPATLLIAGGTAGMALVGVWPAAIALTVVGGCGFGMTDTLCNALVAAEAPREGGAALNLLHMFFGVGALLGPLLVGALLAASAGWHAVFLITSVLACSSALLFALVPIPLPVHLARPDSKGIARLTAATPANVASHSARRGLQLWLLAGMLCLFVGMEQLIGGWSSPYLNRVFGMHLDDAARSAALFWAAVTLGRLLASAIALRLSNERLLGGNALLALAALVAMALAGAVSVALVALSVAGLAFAPIYPTLMAITARAYPRRFATLAGILVAAGGLGGAVFPWVGGVVGQDWGLRATIWFGIAIAAALVSLFAIFLAQNNPIEETE